MGQIVQTRAKRLNNLLPPTIQARFGPHDFKDEWTQDGKHGSIYLHHPTESTYRGRNQFETVADKIVANGNCQLLMIGLGKGGGLSEFIRCVGQSLPPLREEEMMKGLKIDVFSATATIEDQFLPLIRRDLSGTKKNPRFVETHRLNTWFRSEDRYDVVFDAYGAGVKTKHPPRVVIKYADSLAVDGVAFINLYDKDPEKTKRLCNNFWQQKREKKHFNIVEPAETKKYKNWMIVERVK